MENKDLKKLGSHWKEFIDWNTEKKITWCGGGCGNFGIQNALMRALTLEEKKREEVVFCFDVGCVGNGSDKIEGYTLHGLHGRVLPLAAGAKIANSNLTVIAEAGDGGTFSEGINHLVHAVRNDYPIMFILHNNENYGLTTGQASALTRLGVKMNASPDGVYIDPLNACQVVLGLSPSFVARTYSANMDHMTEMFRKGMNHKGFSFIEVFQHCPTYNRATLDDWYAERIKDVSTLKNYDRTDIWQARKIVEDLEKDIYVGLLYENPKKADFLSVQPNRNVWGSNLAQEVKHYDVRKDM